MNREIKFRAYNKKHGLCEPFTLKSISEFNCKESGCGEHYWQNDTVFMQYTGLKDKNSKEIYEGDIVNVKLPDGPKWIGEKIKGKIEYDEVGCRYLINQYFDESFCYDYYQIHEDLKIEVIGNIYENTDLC